MPRRVNNYVRVGVHPMITIITFDDTDPAELERVRQEVSRVSGGRPYGIAIWRKCRGLEYPVVGEVRRMVYS